MLKQNRYLLILLGLFGLLLLGALWLTRGMAPYTPVAASPTFRYSDAAVRTSCQDKLLARLGYPKRAEFVQDFVLDSVKDGYKAYSTDILFTDGSLYGGRSSFVCQRWADGRLEVFEIPQPN